MASGISRVVRGSVVGTGTAINIKTVGFRPRSVKLWNVGTHKFGMWQHTMADATAVKSIADGTQSLAATNGITPLADGFILGTDSDLNATGELVHWEAVE